MPKPDPPREIKGTIAMLVEGIDETNFFSALLSHLSISGVELLDVGGKRNFRVKFPGVLKMTGFPKIQAYAIIRDADDNAEQAFQSVQHVLRDNKEPVPHTKNTFATGGSRKVGVFILPGDLSAGMLEDVCMKTVAGHPVLQCVDSFMDCIADKIVFPPMPDPNAPPLQNFRHPNNANKARAKAFLAAQEHDLPSVGIAAQAGVWNFNHSSLDELKLFLRQLAGV